ncbi:hypothetical protein COS75_01920 [Candidatus Pacearchaeota archaeon CG06_land_8_20_14_3_00_35_12]|nr:MAG: hypothetical protein COS75_01920 [Candidatus Pacearchaeota archaeon CG06_land_8_20_14_3_00_35_12]
MAEEKCVFCQIIDGSLPTIKIYEDKTVLAILDINPASEGHVILMPRTHYETLDQIPDDVLVFLFKLAKLLSGIIKKVMKATGINIYACEGKSAGQRLPHFYINLIPSYDDNPVSAEWERKQVEPKKLEEIGNKIRDEAKKESIKLVTEETEKIKKKITKKIADESAKKQKIEKKKEDEEMRQMKSLIGRRIP